MVTHTYTVYTHIYIHIYTFICGEKSVDVISTGVGAPQHHRRSFEAWLLRERSGLCHLAYPLQPVAIHMNLPSEIFAHSKCHHSQGSFQGNLLCEP